MSKNQKDIDIQKLIDNNSFVEVYEHIKQNILFLHSAIDNYKFIYKTDYQTYKTICEIAPSFFNATNYSFIVAILTTLNNLVDRDTVVGIQTLTKIVLENNKDDKQIIYCCKSIIDCIKSHSELMEHIRNARNKIYCHFDLNVLDEKYINDNNQFIKIDEIEVFLRDLELYLTDLHMYVYNDGAKQSLSYINSLDAKNFKALIETYDKYQPYFGEIREKYFNGNIK